MLRAIHDIIMLKEQRVCVVLLQTREPLTESMKFPNYVENNATDRTHTFKWFSLSKRRDSSVEDDRVQVVLRGGNSEITAWSCLGY
jgi:hypothetical protein